MDSPHFNSKHYSLQEVEMTGRKLGAGFHADVFEVRYKGLTCAAKKFKFLRECTSKTLLEEYYSRTHEHCELLGRLRHPNIVQFIGFYCELGSRMPIILYECLHITLEKCIEKYDLLPENIGYSILNDTAIALRYLHEYCTPIPHQNLSATKVLLTRDMTAKLADAGVTNITGLQQLNVERRSIGKPGSITNIAIQNDIYAFGLLVIYVVTGRNPLVEIQSSSDFHCDSSMSINEDDIVSSYLSEFQDDHPLLKIVEQCLNTNPMSRPSALTVSCKLGQVSVKHPPLYANFLEMLHKIEHAAEDKLTPQNTIEITQNQEMSQLQDMVTKMSAQNIALQASLLQNSESIENGNHVMVKKQLRRQSNLCISSPVDVSTINNTMELLYSNPLK